MSTITPPASEGRHSAPPSTFASRRAQREAQEAAGEMPPERRHTSFRAGIDVESRLVVINRVRA